MDIIQKDLKWNANTHMWEERVGKSIECINWVCILNGIACFLTPYMFSTVLQSWVWFGLWIRLQYESHIWNLFDLLLEPRTAPRTSTELRIYLVRGSPRCLRFTWLLLLIHSTASIVRGKCITSVRTVMLNKWAASCACHTYRVQEMCFQNRPEMIGFICNCCQGNRIRRRHLS